MKKNVASVIIFVLAGMIAALGIWQLILFIPPQLEMLDNAAAQGATAEQTSDYYWHDFMPQILTYVITFLGFAALLFTAGMLYLRLAANQPSYNRNMAGAFPSEAAVDGETDDFFDGFEVVDTEQGK